MLFSTSMYSQQMYRRTLKLMGTRFDISVVSKDSIKSKEYIDAIKSISECIDCGESNPLVLDFDHVRGNKKMCISNMVRNSYSIETIQKEIEKCEIRCSNCHRIVTHKRIKNER